MRTINRLFILFIVYLWFGTPNLVWSQVKISEWVAHSGTPGWDIVNDITVDTSGCVYITGSNGDTTLSSSLSNIKTNALRHQYIEKFDTSGSLLWHRSILPASVGYGGLITVTPDNRIILAGVSAQQENSDQKPRNKNVAFFLTCLDTDGELLWTQTFQGTKLDYLTSLSIDPADQSIQLAGYFQDTLQIGQEVAVSFHRSDAILLSFTPSGQFMNLVHLKGIGDERINGVTYDQFGDAYVVGTFQKSVILQGETSLEHEIPAEDAVFIAQFSTTGKLNKSRKCIKRTN